MSDAAHKAREIREAVRRGETVILDNWSGTYRVTGLNPERLRVYVMPVDANKGMTHLGRTFHLEPKTVDILHEQIA